MFELGSTYSRQQINAAIGGGVRACLLQSRGNVVGVCFVPKLNPQAPRVILVGRGPQKEKAAQQLALQAAPVPVFAKRDRGAYVHLGAFKGEKYVAASDALAPYAQGSGRDDVAGALLLAPVAEASRRSQ